MSGFEVIGVVMSVLPLINVIISTIEHFQDFRGPKEVRDQMDLAREMDQNPEIGIFRRFGELNNFSLLYMQAEIASLEQEFLAQRGEDLQSSCQITQSYNFSMDRLRCFEGRGAAKQRDLLMDIQAKLKIYSKSSLST